MRSLAAPKADFDATIALIDAGDLAKAEARARAKLAEYPRDVNLQALLGALLVKLNRGSEADALLRQVIAEAPTFAKPHEDLGHLLVQQGRAADALPFLERATHLDPSLEFAWFTLGKALAMQGRGSEADRAFERSFALSPERRLMALAAEHHKEGRLEEAERLYRRVLRQRPRNVDAMRLLASIALKAGHADEAEQLLERAISIAPDFAMAHVDLGRLRKEQDRFVPALECFDRAIALDPDNPHTHYLRGATLAPAALTHEAIEAYQACLALRPTHVGALLGLGHLLKAVGRYDDAVASYDACIRQRPDLGESYWSLANLKTYRFSEATVAEMERRVHGGGLTVQSEVNFLFALGKAHEDRGEFDRAWKYYQGGNSKQRSAITYDPVQTEAMNDRLLRVFDGDFLQCRRGVGLTDPRPDLHPRAAALRLHAAGADPREPQPGRGHQRAAIRQPVANWLNRNRADGINYPEAVRELAPANFRSLGEDYLGYARAAPSHGRATVHRQDAEQLSARRPAGADPAGGEDHRCASPSARCLPELLPAALRQGTELHL